MAAAATLAFDGASAAAATLNVSTTTDELTPKDGHCSLREAISAANSPGTASDCGTASSGANTIVLPAGHYTLTLPGAGEDNNLTGDLDIRAPVTVVGAGAGASIIDANGIDRVLQVLPGVVATIRSHAERRRLEKMGFMKPSVKKGRGPNRVKEPSERAAKRLETAGAS
jgi:CSLREA domain-containing protein